ncbi:MAG: hypothetical protein JWN24_4530 [Phycisphaerales bacterium]|nr:hypothetical protein [Phycisphaerales bacterium]
MSQCDIGYFRPKCFSGKDLMIEIGNFKIRFSDIRDRMRHLGTSGQCTFRGTAAGWKMMRRWRGDDRAVPSIRAHPRDAAKNKYFPLAFRTADVRIPCVTRRTLLRRREGRWGKRESGKAGRAVGLQVILLFFSEFEYRCAASADPQVEGWGWCAGGAGSGRGLRGRFGRKGLCGCAYGGICHSHDVDKCIAMYLNVPGARGEEEMESESGPLWGGPCCAVTAHRAEHAGVGASLCHIGGIMFARVRALWAGWSGPLPPRRWRRAGRGCPGDRGRGARRGGVRCGRSDGGSPRKTPA